ncbi:response regulator [Actinomadura verrucosospora]|uniref:LuxR family two component transcriptional regulator n=1 Tax=Actinomadura verrucosospora TaxID=46165 RepID=A0A7D3ZLS7_ACTVE|nr:response regulator transcription factor [Actinomadura verrucosospora]QKG23301.1 LuxR family two component transcriptional regulator [Actinomadura verrucosospora]
MTIRVLLADDQEMVRAALRVVIDRRDGLAVAGEAADGAEAVAEAARLRPDVVVMDVRMPGMTGVEATRRIMTGPWEGGARPRVLVLTTFDLDEYVYAALRAGASGFLLKNSPIDQLEHAIRVVAAGEAMLAPSVTRRLVTAFAAVPPAPEPRAPGRLDDLTGREREVLLLVARGLPNARIAELLGLSEANVKSRVNRILARLGLENRVQAAILAYEEGLPGLRDGAGPPG